MLPTDEHDETRRLLLLSAKGVALITIYAAYGVLQERIMKGHYDNPLASTSEPIRDRFTSVPFLVLCNRLVSLATGLLLSQVRPSVAEQPSISPSDRLCGRIPFRISSNFGRLKPSSPFLYYALVAGLNNLATLSQYASLAYLSFTTATLGKCAKMVPILVFGYIGYGKRHQPREWVGVGVIVAGIWGYLVSLPKVQLNDDQHAKAKFTNSMGLVCLVAYLFFDGQTSLTQERLFGKSRNGKPLLLGLTGPVMDQMIWVNFFSSLIALQMLLLDSSTSTASSLRLVMVSPVLQFHVIMLSLTATCGLLLLFHVIATHGALISGLLMTLRQFVSVVCNAICFGNLTKVSPRGWASIGFVAAGVWIKMDRQYDDTSTSEKSDESYLQLQHPSPKKRSHPWIRQYIIPLVVCPLVFLLLTSTLTLFTTIGDATTKVISESVNIDQNPLQSPVPVQQENIRLSNRPPGKDLKRPLPAISSSDPPIILPGKFLIGTSNRPPATAASLQAISEITAPESSLPAKDLPADPPQEAISNFHNFPLADHLKDKKLAESIPPHSKPFHSIKEETGNTQLSESGNIWDDLFVAAVNPECPEGSLNSVRYNTNIRTAIATYPRSGSSYTRNLIERATGFQTSSLYCDPPFDKYFKAECDGLNNPWVVKTHFPSELKHKDDHDIHWQHFDRYLEIVRNPVDAVWSLRNLLTTFDHSRKLEGVKFDSRSHQLLLPHLEDYNEFLRYWAKAPIQGLVIRYEDLRRSPAVHLAEIVDFLLPEEDLPSPERMACALKLDKEKEMYPSPKISPFQDWQNHFTRETFDWIIEVTAEPWCTWGYDRLLLEEKGFNGPVNCTKMRNQERVPIDFGSPEKG